MTTHGALIPPAARRPLSLFSRCARMKRVCEMKLSLKPFSKGLRSLEAEPQVASRRTRNPLLKPGVRPGFQFKHQKNRSPQRAKFSEKTTLLGGLFHERTLCAKYCASADALFLFFLVDFRKSENQKGVSRSAERDSGLCPENPRPFEKGRRKLHCLVRCYSSV